MFDKEQTRNWPVYRPLAERSFSLEPPAVRAAKLANRRQQANRATWIPPRRRGAKRSALILDQSRNRRFGSSMLVAGFPQPECRDLGEGREMHSQRRQTQGFSPHYW